jgi:predicted aspartyl protease
MTYRALLAIAFLFATAAHAAAADEGAALLAKHKAYVGWEFGDGSVTSVKLSGRIDERMKDGTLKPFYNVTELRVGLISHRSATKITTGVTNESGFTGNVFWESSSNGFTVPERGESIKYIAARSVLFDEVTTTLPAQAVKHETVGGVAVVVLREQIPSAFPIDLYVDPQTGAFTRAVLNPVDNPETIIIDAYAEPIPGKRLIGAYHFEGSSYRDVYDKIEFNTPIGAADLHPPKASAAWVFGNGDAIPIELRAPDLKSGRTYGEAGYRLYVHATVNGIAGRFIVDTGAFEIALTPDFAKRANVKRVGTQRVSGIGSYASGNADVDRADSIGFADGSVLQNITVGSGIDMGDERADGLLGFDFMGGAILVFDLDAQQLRIFDPVKMAPNETAAIIATPDLTDGVPSLPISIDGNVKGNAMVDTGNPGSTMLSANFLAKVPVLIDDSSLGSTFAFSGATGGYEIDRCGWIASIALGPIEYKHVHTCFSGNMDPGDGLLGLDFLQNFNFTLDYPDGKIVMYKRAR